MIMKKTFRGALVALAMLTSAPANAEDQIRLNSIPLTISKEAQKELAAIYASRAYARVFPDADDLDGWKATHDAAEETSRPANDKAVADNKVTVTELTLGGVPVLDIRPEGWEDDGKVLVYTHGGAYTLFSARTTMRTAAPMARVTGRRIISVDYTTSPFARWDVIQEQVLSVFRALQEQGYEMQDLAIYGDSAGGGLAASTVLNLRDQGMGLPAAVVLLSPWVDISDAGDTIQTLGYTDPSLNYGLTLATSAEAYAGGLNLKDPRVSPVYGDFTKGFSPALITDGTKVIFLSASVRLYQALEAAGQVAKLDIYEGMWHVFQQNPTPETEVSFSKIKVFLDQHFED